MRFKKAVAELILAVMIGAFFLAIGGHFMRLFDGALFIGCRVLVIIGATIGGPILAVGTIKG